MVTGLGLMWGLPRVGPVSNPGSHFFCKLFLLVREGGRLRLAAGVLVHAAPPVVVCSMGSAS